MEYYIKLLSALKGVMLQGGVKKSSLKARLTKHDS